MKDPRKTILISGIISLIAGGLNMIFAYLDLSQNFSSIILIFDIVSISISLIVGIYMIIVSKFDLEKLAKQQKIFLALTFIAIFGSFITWILTFYSYFALSNFFRYKMIYKEKLTPFGNVIDAEATIEDKAEFLSKEIKKLEKSRDKGEISEEEFLKLKSDLINKFL